MLDSMTIQQWAFDHGDHLANMGVSISDAAWHSNREITLCGCDKRFNEVWIKAGRWSPDLVTMVMTNLLAYHMTNQTTEAPVQLEPTFTVPPVWDGKVYPTIHLSDLGSGVYFYMSPELDMYGEYMISVSPTWGPEPLHQGFIVLRYGNGN